MKLIRRKVTKEQKEEAYREKIQFKDRETCFVCGDKIAFLWQRKVYSKSKRNDRLVSHERCSVGSNKWIKSPTSLCSNMYTLISGNKFWTSELTDKDLKNTHVSSDGYRRRISKKESSIDIKEKDNKE